MEWRVAAFLGILWSCMLIFPVAADELISNDVLVNKTDLPSINQSILWGDTFDAVTEREQLQILHEDEKLTLSNGSGKTSFTFLSESPFIQLTVEDIADFNLRQ